MSPRPRKFGELIGKKRRVYDKEFKGEAVRLATKGDRTISDVAENLKINPGLLGKWIKSGREEGPEAFRGQGKRTAIEEEIWQLKLENRRLEQELDFLKKVSRYFANESYP